MSFSGYGMNGYSFSQRLGSFEADPGFGGFTPEVANPRDQQVADKMKSKAGVYGNYGDYSYFGLTAEEQAAQMNKAAADALAAKTAAPATPAKSSGISSKLLLGLATAAGIGAILYFKVLKK